MLLPAPLVPSKGLCRLTADSEFNALEPSLARGPGRRETTVFHPRSPADWFSGAGSSVALLVAFCALLFRFLFFVFLAQKSEQRASK